MKQVYMFDSEGKFIEPVIIYPDEEGNYIIPDDCTNQELPQPNWKPVFKDGKWVETITDEELAELSKPPEPTEIELLKKENENLKQQLAQTNNDLQGFMDFYFSTL